MVNFKKLKLKIIKLVINFFVVVIIIGFAIVDGWIIIKF